MNRTPSTLEKAFVQTLFGASLLLLGLSVGSTPGCTSSPAPVVAGKPGEGPAHGTNQLVIPKNQRLVEVTYSHVNARYLSVHTRTFDGQDWVFLYHRDDKEGWTIVDSTELLYPTFSEQIR